MGPLYAWILSDLGEPMDPVGNLFGMALFQTCVSLYA